MSDKCRSMRAIRLANELQLERLKEENEYVSTHIYRSLSERIITIDALFRIGIHPQDALDILYARGWSSEEILEAIQVQVKSLGPYELL